MPITYATPDPVIPGISAAYGGAQQFSQDAPMIAGIAQHSASLTQQGLAHGDQIRLAYAQANAQAQQHAADRLSQENAGNANREQQGLDLGAQLSQRRDEAQLHSDTQLAAQRQGAELQNWLGQQDLSQKEQMRLQQINTGTGEIESAVQNGTLSREQGNENLARLKGWETPLRQRLLASQERENAAQTAALEQKTMTAAKLEVEANKIRARSMSDNTHYIIPQAARAEAEAAFDQNFPEITAAAKMGGPQGMAAQAMREKMITEEAQQDPRSQQFLQTKPDAVHNVTKDLHDQNKDHSDRQMALHQAAVKEYDTKLESAIKRQDSPGYVPPEGEKGASVEDRAAVSLARQGLFRPQPPTAKEQRQPFAGYKRSAPAAPLAPQSVMPPPVDESAKKVMVSQPPFNLKDTKSGTPEQREMIDSLSTVLKNVHMSPLPTAVKMQMTQAVTHIENLLSEFGSPQKMQADASDLNLPAERRDRASRSYSLYNNAMKMLESAPRPNVPAPMPPTPQQVPTRGFGWANPYGRM